MKKYLDSVKIIILGSMLAIGISYISAWTGPNGTAPLNNTPTPVNISSGAQAKTGLLGLSALQFNPNGSSSVTPGYVLTAVDNLGNVGWRAQNN